VERGIGENIIEDAEGQAYTLVDEAVQFARQAPPARVEDALTGVYGDTHNGLVF
jgi:TPP-dependent pyruvate/acetoin dehydrogenase alpha subunit